MLKTLALVALASATAFADDPTTTAPGAPTPNPAPTQTPTPAPSPNPAPPTTTPPTTTPTTAPTAPKPAAPATTAPSSSDAKSTATSERGLTSAPISTAKEDDEGAPKLSLPTESDRVAWQKTGFRLGIGLTYGELKGLGGAPSGRLLGTQLHVGLRLDPSWSIMSTFQYASVSKKGGLSGLRFVGTIDPTWHVRPNIAIAIGVGFGGIVEGRTDRMDVDPLPSTLDTSYTFPDAKTPLPSCSGVGVAGLARGEYDLVLGSKLAMNVSVEILGQYTSCVATTGRVDPDTAQPIERRQYWPHAGATLSWGLMWR